LARGGKWKTYDSMLPLGPLDRLYPVAQCLLRHCSHPHQGVRIAGSTHNGLLLLPPGPPTPAINVSCQHVLHDKGKSWFLHLRYSLSASSCSSSVAFMPLLCLLALAPSSSGRSPGTGSAATPCCREERLVGSLPLFLGVPLPPHSPSSPLSPPSLSSLSSPPPEGAFLFLPPPPDAPFPAGAFFPFPFADCASCNLKSSESSPAQCRRRLAGRRICCSGARDGPWVLKPRGMVPVFSDARG
jgi:hypothetical protein